MRTLISLPLLLIATAACSSPRTDVTEQDRHGNYVTTSDYQAMERAEFQTAMRAGLADFDSRVTQLRQRANELGGESLEEFSEWAEELKEKRVDFVNHLNQTEAALVGAWPDQREDTLESYNDLRDCLDEAYEEVLET